MQLEHASVLLVVVLLTTEIYAFFHELVKKFVHPKKPACCCYLTITLTLGINIALLTNHFHYQSCKIKGFKNLTGVIRRMKLKGYFGSETFYSKSEAFCHFSNKLTLL